jgi:hypothetical protein
MIISRMPSVCLILLTMSLFLASDRASELLHRIAGDLNRSKRQIILIIPISENTEIVWQVTSYSKMLEFGSLPQIHGKPTMPPASCAMLGQHRGLSRATSYRNGNLRDRALFCGSMANVRLLSSPVLFII